MLGVLYSDNYRSLNDFKSPQDYLSYLYGATQGYISRAYISNKTDIWNEKTYSLPYLSKKRYHGESDVYISMNTFFNMKKGRVTENLKDLNTLYIDIDCYTKGYTQDEVIGLLETEYFDTIIPTPTFVIKSGRGVYLIYKLIRGEKSKAQESGKAITRWTSVQKFLFSKLQHFGADAKALDAARVLRLPFTYNSKSDTQVSIVRFYNYSYTLDSIIKEYSVSYDSTKRKQKWGVPTERQIKVAKWQAKAFDVPVPDFNNYADTYNFIAHYRSLTPPHQENCTIRKRGYSLSKRIDDLFTLFGVRKGEDCCREYALFLCRLWTLVETGDEEYALSKTLALNERMDCPFKTNYVITRTRSAETAFLKNTPYTYSTSKVIEVLDITPEEQQLLSCLRTRPCYLPQKRSEQNRIAYRKRLEQQGETTKKDKINLRREKIRTLLYQGVSSADICDMLGISLRTYNRDKAAIQEMDSYSVNTDCQCQEKEEKSVIEKKAYKLRLYRYAIFSALILYGYFVQSAPLLWKILLQYKYLVDNFVSFFSHNRHITRCTDDIEDKDDEDDDIFDTS